MLNDLAFFWKHREQPNKLSRWFIVWVKRFLQFIPLCRILFRTQWLKIKGASIGKLVVIGKVKCQGPLTHLYIGEQTSLGRCEIALHDHIVIGRCVVINDGAVLLTASHSISNPKWNLKKKPITIGDYAWLATNTIILPGVRIGRGAVIGAGSIVRDDVPDYAVVIGNPAIVQDVKRTKMLNYSPVLFNAPFEAWIGRNISNLSIELS